MIFPLPEHREEWRGAEGVLGTPQLEVAVQAAAEAVDLFFEGDLPVSDTLPMDVATSIIPVLGTLAQALEGEFSDVELVVAIRWARRHLLDSVQYIPGELAEAAARMEL